MGVFGKRKQDFQPVFFTADQSWGSGFRGLGFRGLGFRGFGFRGLGG